MLSLGLIALASATLLPGGSEAALAGLWCEGVAPWALWLAATLGNTLGSLINVALGRGARRLRTRRWFPVSRRALARGTLWYRRIGAWSLLLSWAPVIGDPLTVLAGVFRLPWWKSVLLILVAKGGRYALLLVIADHWLTPWCT
ncbi:DedA family protein [Cobetia marina]|uniref:YqaA family protein n=1 Tax=Cobetia marina TaxID=28258 RepID=A0ABU9GHI6_COBMA|nr:MULTISPECIES: YqaA family protein [Cobetia]MDA5563918.1 DedA family protein [Cobetia sp. MMG027]MDH2291810.1 DedA family protein [Cobetia sp. 10Alg 146]MDH2374346.1 DedA family protein [Cobetia sp. 3AK]MDI6004466.1 YqaA family protein [Cobetia pacifica]MDO6787503.1 YqaA family protein [Cobetia marina]